MATQVHPRSSIARRGDPATSLEAEELVTLSGKRDAQAQRLLTHLVRWLSHESSRIDALEANLKRLKREQKVR